MGLAESIRNIRFKLGLNMGEFAKLIGRTRSAVSLYESGKRQPTAGLRRKMVDMAKKQGLEIEYSDLMEKEE